MLDRPLTLARGGLREGAALALASEGGRRRPAASAAHDLPGLPQGGVGSAVLEQLVVRADLAEEAVLDDRDAVGVVRGVQAMGDRDDRPAVEHRAERALEVAGGARVEERGRLVEHERVRVGEDEPRERELLGLRRRQRLAAGADRRLETVGQRLGPLERVDRRERRLELGVRRLRSREPQVVGQRADEDVLLLRDERDLLPERLERELDETDAADLDLPVRGGWIPASSRPRVDLPAPDGPTTATRSPGRRSRSIPWSTSRPSTYA